MSVIAKQQKKQYRLDYQKHYVEVSKKQHAFDESIKHYPPLVVVEKHKKSSEYKSKDKSNEDGKAEKKAS